MIIIHSSHKSDTHYNIKWQKEELDRILTRIPSRKARTGNSQSRVCSWCLTKMPAPMLTWERSWTSQRRITKRTSKCHRYSNRSTRQIQCSRFKCPRWNSMSLRWVSRRTTTSLIPSSAQCPSNLSSMNPLTTMLKSHSPLCRIGTLSLTL